LVGWETTIHRIDSERKKTIKFRIEWLQVQHPFPKQIPVERFQMTYIKDNAVAFANRTVIQSFGLNDVE
jgi:hypothetical protein